MPGSPAAEPAFSPDSGPSCRAPTRPAASGLLDRGEDPDDLPRTTRSTSAPRTRPTESGSTTPRCAARGEDLPLDPSAPGSREQVTYGDWNERGRRAHPRQQEALFTSDRDGGIFNIYSINLDNGETSLHTNVVAGAFSPGVSERTTPRSSFLRLLQAAVHLYIADAKKPSAGFPILAPSISPPGGVV